MPGNDSRLLLAFLPHRIIDTYFTHRVVEKSMCNHVSMILCGKKSCGSTPRILNEVLTGLFSKLQMEELTYEEALDHITGDFDSNNN